MGADENSERDSGRMDTNPEQDGSGSGSHGGKSLGSRGISGDVSLPSEEFDAGSFTMPGDDSRYRLLDEIARGGMGAILKIVDKDIRRPVAMKVMLGEEDLDMIQRFVEEAQITGQLEHPNIVPVHELGLNPEGKVYFTMKLVRGSSLAEIVETAAAGKPGSRSGRSLFELLDVFVKASEAVAFAHSKGVIHRDLKPENVMVGKFGEVLVMDWGLAKVLGKPEKARKGKVVTDRSEEHEDRTRDGDVMGTPSFMPPEQANGMISEIDAISDVYSLGGILFKMLTHTSPHRGRDTRAVLVSASRGEVEPARKRAPKNRIPAELESICSKALEPEKADRYQSVNDLVADVRAFLEHRPVSAHRYGPVSLAVRFVQRHPGPTLAGAVGVIVLTIAAGIVVALTSWAREQQAKAQASALRAKKAEVRADQAEDALAKGRTVSAVMRSAERELGPLYRELKRSWYSPSSIEAKRAAGMKLWPQVEAFGKTVPPDRSAQAAWLAAKGWLRRYAGFADEAITLFADSGRADRDVAFGPLFAAMDCLVQYIENQPVPEIYQSSIGFHIGKFSEGNRNFTDAAARLPELLDKTRKARVLGEYTGREFDEVINGLRGIHKGDLAEASRGLDRAMLVPEMRWIEEELLLARAKVRYLSSDFRGALADTDRCLSNLPDWHNAHAQRGFALVGIANSLKRDGFDAEAAFRDAAGAFGNAISAAPHASHFSNRGRALANAGFERADKGADAIPDLEAAIRDFDEAVNIDPELGTAYSGRGSAMRRRSTALSARGIAPGSDLIAALKDLNDAVRRLPGDWTALNERGQVHMALGDADEKSGRNPVSSFAAAAADFSAAIALAADAPDPYCNLGTAHTRIGIARAAAMEDPGSNFKEALAALSECIRIDPRNSAAYNTRSVLNRKRADLEARRRGDSMPLLTAAIEDAQEAVRLKPGNHLAWNNLATARFMMGSLQLDLSLDPTKMYDAAIVAFAECVKIKPDYANGHSNLGGAYLSISQSLFKMGHDPAAYIVKARSALEDALRWNPRSFIANKNLGDACALMATLAEARGEPASELFEDSNRAYVLAARINPRDADLHAKRGAVLEKLERFVEALESFEKSLSLPGGGTEKTRTAVERMREKLRK